VRGWPWPVFDSKFLLLLLVTSVPAGVNGAVGAGLAAALGRRRRLLTGLLRGNAAREDKQEGGGRQAPEKESHTPHGNPLDRRTTSSPAGGARGAMNSR
jgi:hypothetical protein